MLYTISKHVKNRARAVFFAFALLIIIAGCAAKQSATVPESDANADEERAINGIYVTDEAGALKISIQGSSPLRYTSVKQAFPLGIVLYFPGTKLENIDSEYPPEGQILNSIKTSQQSHSAGYDSRIKILLNEDVDYDIIRGENGLVVALAQPESITPETLEAGKDTYTVEDTASEVAVEDSLYGSGDNLDTTAMEEEPLDEPEIAVEINSEPVYTEADTADLDSADMRVEPVVVSTEEKQATQVISVDNSIAGDHAEVTILADGKIKDYNVFSIPSNDQKGARIVCDIFNLKGIDTKGEQKIGVNSHGIQDIRYFSYPEKMRIVIDTVDENLENYTTVSGSDDLILRIGGKAASVADAADVADVPIEVMMMETQVAEAADTEPLMDDTLQIESDPVTSMEEEPVTYEEPVETMDSEIMVEPVAGTAEIENGNTMVDETEPGVDEAPYAEAMDESVSDTAAPAALAYTGSTWVNRIDFESEKDGKSAIIIGTNHPVDYKISKKDDKTVHLRLMGTKLPKSRRFPFITTRFESAVNRIIPVQTDGMKDNTLFIIELRESVPYFVDQQGDIILVNFEASTVPPQPEDMAGLPMWKEVLSKTPEIKEIEREVASGEDYAGPVGSSKSFDKPSAPRPSIVRPGTTEPMTSVEIIIPEEPTPADAAVMKSESESEDVAGYTEPAPDASVVDAETMDMAPEMDESPPEESMEPQGGFVSWAQKKKYTGEKISVDFYETDIKNVFRIIRSVSGQNFAIDKDVTGKVTMTLDQPVPWDQVLDLVLKMNMLGMVKEGNINRIATLETLKQEEEKRLEYIAAEEKTKMKKKSLEPVYTEYILINYSNADKEIKPHIEKMLTPERGTISVDVRTNQIILTDTKEKIKEAKDLIKKLDKITPQVVIEARIVEASTSFSRQFGTEWSLDSNENYDTYSDTLGGTYGYSVAMNNGVAAESSIGINFTKLTGAQFLLNATLLAMESKGEGKIVSAPKILTMDNKQATITQGSEVAFETVSSEGTQTTFKKVELKLEVTPHVTSDNKISMEVVIDKNDIGEVTDIGPTITTKKVESEILINDGDTIVIGGIIKSSKSTTDEGFPVLQHIPVIGWLFKSRIRSDDKEELLVFLTPRIMSYEETVR